MMHIRLLSAVTLLLVALSPAFAADPVFHRRPDRDDPPWWAWSGPRPLSGLKTEDESVKVLIAELPPEAYGEVVNAFKVNPAGTGGIKPESIETSTGPAYYTAENTKENTKDGPRPVRRYSMILQGGTFSGYVAVQVPENASKIYTDEAVRQMFASAVVRKEVPVEEQLALLPYKVSDLAGFKNVRTPDARRRRHPDR